MALPGSGAISASMIRTELNIPSQAPFSLSSASLVHYTDLNALSISSSGDILDIADPNAVSEWRNYNHTFTSSLAPYTGLRVPYGYPYTTFAQVNIGSNSAVIPFTASNFVTSGLDLDGNVPYSIYYSTYPNITSSKFIKSGVLTKTSNSSSFTYNYNASSGSVVTFLFAPFLPYLYYDANAYVSTVDNLGTGGSTFNLPYIDVSNVVVSSSGLSYYDMTAADGQITGSSGINLNGTNFSCHVIYYYSSIGAFDTGDVFSIGDSNGANSFQIFNSQGTIVTGNYSSNIGYTTNGYILNANTWYSYIVTANSLGATVEYLNGGSKQSVETISPGSTSSSKVRIGKYLYSPTTHNFRIGLVRFFNNTILSDTQALAEYDLFKSRYPI